MLVHKITRKLGVSPSEEIFTGVREEAERFVLVAMGHQNVTFIFREFEMTKVDYEKELDNINKESALKTIGLF